MAKFVGILLCLAVLVNTGFSLNCYMCHSEKLDGCLKGSSGIKEQKCGNPVPGTKSICYYKHSYDAAKKMDKIDANCSQLPEKAPTGTLPTECQKEGTLEIKECRVCEGTLCNSAPAFSNSLFALLCLPFMYFVTKFLL